MAAGPPQRWICLIWRGKILYAIGLQVESSEDVTDYQVNLGRLTLTEKKRAALNGPADVALDEILYRDAYTAEVRMYWTAVTGAASYEIYQVHPDGSKSLIMETPNTAYYIPTLNRDAAEEDVTLEVLPVNRNGVRGKATTFTIDWAYGNQDSEKIENKYFENVCLNAPVTGVSFEKIPASLPPRHWMERRQQLQVVRQQPVHRLDVHRHWPGSHSAALAGGACRVWRRRCADEYGRLCSGVSECRWRVGPGQTDSG